MTAPASTLPVAVIGAGFSGTMAALHLLPRIGSRSILLCERGGRFARGIAYGTDDPGHLLNVRAANMSAYPEQPDHFLDWLGRAEAARPEQVHATSAGTFVSRHLYGQYLASLLNDAVAGRDGASRLILVPDEAVDLVPEADGYRLVLAGGVSHRIAGVVLAAGNLLPAGSESDPHVANPWATTFTDGLSEGEPVVVVGSGLTMVDIALHLQRAGFAGPLIAISRRGLRPHVHAATTRRPALCFTDQECASPALLLRRLRREVVAVSGAGVPWRDVVDSLRPITSRLWRGFSADRQDSFLRHARPWWDVHRHRTAPPVGAALEAMIASGFLTIRAGHIVNLAAAGRAVQVTLRPRGATATATIVAQRVINASGSRAPDRCGNPFIERLIGRGLVRLDRHGLGLDQTDDLCLVGTSGERSPGLWALGPLGAGAFWECVAVPDIRQQAVHVAETIARSLGSVGHTPKPALLTTTASSR